MDQQQSSQFSSTCHHVIIFHINMCNGEVVNSCKNVQAVSEYFGALVNRETESQPARWMHGRQLDRQTTRLQQQLTLRRANLQVSQTQAAWQSDEIVLTRRNCLCNSGLLSVVLSSQQQQIRVCLLQRSHRVRTSGSNDCIMYVNLSLFINI